MTAAPPSTRRRLVRLARWLALIALVAFVVVALTRQGRDVVDRLDEVSAVAVAVALVLGLLAVGCSALSWRTVLADLGSPLPTADAARIFFVGQLGKYVPGSVWPVVTQMQLGKVAGVPRARMATTYLVTLGLSVAAGLLLGLLALPGLVVGGGGWWAWSLLLVPVALACAHPRVLNPVLERGLRLARRPALEHPLTGRGITVATGWALLQWVANGAAAAVLAHDLGASGALLLPLAVGGSALAVVLGLLFIPAPAGAGVREAVLVVALHSVLPTSAATLLALLLRALTTVADVAAAGVAALAARRVAGTVAPTQPAVPTGASVAPSEED